MKTSRKWKDEYRLIWVLIDYGLSAYSTFPQDVCAELYGGLDLWYGNIRLPGWDTADIVLDAVSEINAAGSPFDSYILFSLGYIVGRGGLRSDRETD